MKYQHVHPGEAVEIHKDIKSKKSLGIHWGTFMLTTEYYLEPPVLLTSFMNRYTLGILYQPLYLKIPNYSFLAFKTIFT